ncbi:endonuclease/exonuclease/phosphatase family protein [Bradyrhizobium sp. LHD-71]|uniref:endonuclease/exonuclease/phosphatase family protein n=1 Tax=Bradyrhizobium sp. LHD-71 TaxID=3072141 RepID=UPI00280F58DD|nr:endonuclease/exonuclease/phosphatase family protein [Bradyrhizobium sp. LHD-71]MDQ8729733.1 endonuclease/exonuclease/phosphatase family protein [Bradyrhizobium sp. LHD-71]
MVQYSGLRFWKDAGARDRTIDRLLALRAGLVKTITPNNKRDSFHLATWNIRDFGGHRLNPSPRLPESLLYIAEVISAFDLIAVQEVNEDMADFQKVMRLLGRHWDYIVTDQSGNMERLAFVFDTRKIQFRHVAGEIVLPPKKGKEVIQFNRTPFLVAFQAGWFKFNICTVHIYYGTAQDTAQRKREIADIAAFFTARQKKDGETYILLGDFNILNPDDPTMDALLGSGFEVPAALRKPTALASANYYDQIALRTQNKLAEIRSAGCFRWQDYVFRDDADYEVYKPLMPTKTKTGKIAKTDGKAYKAWRTWQMSDHLPLWVEIKMDFTESYLASLRTGATPLATFDPATGPRPDSGPPTES